MSLHSFFAVDLHNPLGVGPLLVLLAAQGVRIVLSGWLYRASGKPPLQALIETVRWDNDGEGTMDTSRVHYFSISPTIEVSQNTFRA